MVKPAATPVSTLVLVPTRLELDGMGGASAFAAADVRVELCGFGPIAAAARCATLVGQCTPRLVILAGVAGSYDLRAFPLGAVRELASVAFDGLAGTDSFPQWESAGADVIRDRLALRPQAAPIPAAPTATIELVTVLAPARSETEADARRSRFRGALAEDMEGFGVALACALGRVPLCIVRGASNSVGERDKSQWRVTAALTAVAQHVERLLRLATKDGR
ncbi:MAG: hypothetical protein ACKVX7_05195 [Planctomycetota bacterium]